MLIGAGVDSGRVAARYRVVIANFFCERFVCMTPEKKRFLALLMLIIFFFANLIVLAVMFLGGH